MFLSASRDRFDTPSFGLPLVNLSTPQRLLGIAQACLGQPGRVQAGPDDRSSTAIDLHHLCFRG